MDIAEKIRHLDKEVDDLEVWPRTMTLHEVRKLYRRVQRVVLRPDCDPPAQEACEKLMVRIRKLVRTYIYGDW